MTLHKYWATAALCAKEKSYFGVAEVVGAYLIDAARVAALCLIWQALFNQGADTQGMTLHQLLAYTIAFGALGPLLDVRTPASSWLHESTILTQYLRPMGVLGQLAAHTLGGWVPHLLILGLPLWLGAALLGVPMAPRSPWFWPSLLLAVSQGFAVDFLFACLIIRVKNMSYTVHSLRGALTAIFTGGLIPFALLPWGLGNILAYSPLGTLAGAPLALLTGLGDASLLIPAQLLWNILLWPLALWGFAKSRERMVAYGG